MTALIEKAIEKYVASWKAEDKSEEYRVFVGYGNYIVLIILLILELFMIFVCACVIYVGTEGVLEPRIALNMGIGLMLIGSINMYIGSAIPKEKIWGKVHKVSFWTTILSIILFLLSLFCR